MQNWCKEGRFNYETAYLAGREGESLGAEQVEFLKDQVREALKGMDAKLVQRR